MIYTHEQHPTPSTSLHVLYAVIYSSISTDSSICHYTCTRILPLLTPRQAFEVLAESPRLLDPGMDTPDHGLGIAACTCSEPPDEALSLQA